MSRNPPEQPTRTASKPPRAEVSSSSGAKVMRLADHRWITGHRPTMSPSMRQINTLIEHPERLERISPVELHRLVSDVGLTDAMPLFELIAPEQMRHLIDFQVWKHDRMDVRELLDWLAAIAQLPSAAAGAHLRRLDVELIGFLLRSQTNIYLTQEDELPEEPEGAFYSTPDGHFVIDLLGENESDNDQLVTVIDALYLNDPESARGLLHRVMWEIPSELEDLSLRWRTARLEDLGFSDPLTALHIYSFLDPQTVRADESTADRPLRVDPEPLPGCDLTTVLPADRSFWSRAATLVTDNAERMRLGEALRHLANINLSADRIDVADVENAAKSLAHLRGRLSLGLEHLCSSNIDHSGVVLKNVALMRIARLGHSLVLERQRRLMPWLREGRFGRRPRSLDLLPSPLRERLQNLIAPRPYLLEPNGHTRPFESPSDLQVADELVDEALGCAMLVPRECWPAELPAGITLPALFCTDVTNAWLGRLGPLDREAVVSLIEALRQKDSMEVLRSIAHTIAEDRLQRHLHADHIARYEGWLTQLVSSLRRLSPDTFDLRFVDSLLTMSTDDPRLE